MQACSRRVTAAGEETHVSCKACTWLGARPLVNAGRHGHNRVRKLLQRLILQNCSLSKQWGARNAKLTAKWDTERFKAQDGWVPYDRGALTETEYPEMPLYKHLHCARRHDILHATEERPSTGRDACTPTHRTQATKCRINPRGAFSHMSPALSPASWCRLAGIPEPSQGVLLFPFFFPQDPHVWQVTECGSCLTSQRPGGWGLVCFLYCSSAHCGKSRSSLLETTIWECWEVTLMPLEGTSDCSSYKSPESPAFHMKVNRVRNQGGQC